MVHFERFQLTRPAGLLGDFGLLARPRQQVERALDAGDHAGSDTCVTRRGVQLIVTQRTRAIMRTFYVIEI